MLKLFAAYILWKFIFPLASFFLIMALICLFLFLAFLWGRVRRSSTDGT
ncbi:hypothetical protein EV561_107293 [Rhizobium sp. BK376]|nr:hypothetical protein EV561_107293 [Rhizobium sp. BK376]